MVDESMSIPAIWDFINSWFTPTVLFVFLNLMIGTIAVTSGLGTRKQDQQQTKDDPHHHLARAPSVLQRLRSINLPQYTFRSQGNPSSSQENPSSTITTTSSQTNPSSTTTTTTTTTVTTKKTHTHHFDSHRPDDELVQVHEDVQFHTQEDQSHHFDSHQTHEDDQFHHIQEDQIHHFDSHQTHEDDQFDEEESQNHLQLQLQLQLQEPQNHRQEQTPEIERGRSIDEVYSRLQTSHVARTISDTMPAAGEVPVKLAKKMKKSASAKSAFAHFEVTDIVESRRPATVRVSKTKLTIPEEEGSGDDEEVDAKADDFINKFKQQLKLQRLDSIIRYKEMVGRGNNGK